MYNANKNHVGPLKDLKKITEWSPRLPAFWIDQPRRWFDMVEGLLVPNSNYPEHVKYCILITKLQPEVRNKIKDVVIQPTNKYGALKKHLLQIYEEPERQKLEGLLKNMKLGKGYPSQLLNRMKTASQGKLPNDTVHKLWLGQLPEALQEVLLSTDVKDLDKLAKTADLITKNFKPIESNADQVFLGEISKLKTALEGLEASTSRRGMNKTEANSSDSKWLCYHHYRYREKANKCVGQCQWKSTKDNTKRNK